MSGPLLEFPSCSVERGCPARLEKVTTASQSCLEMVCPDATEEFYAVILPNQDGEGSWMLLRISEEI